VAFLDLLSKYLFIMELRFDAMLYSNLGNKTSDAGHIKCSPGSNLALRPQVPTPVVKSPTVACRERGDGGIQKEN